MPPKSETKVELKIDTVPVFYNPDYMVMSVTEIGINVSAGKQTAWQKESSPAGTQTLIAYPLHTGAGPVPENCYSPQDVQDHVAEMIRQCFAAMNKIEREQKGEW